MSKRGHGAMNGGGDYEGSKHKRRREVGSSSDVDVTTSDPIEPSAVNGVGGGGSEWKEQAVKLWQTVKDAVKDGRSLAFPFLRKPSRRLYPDYYVLIKQPIALEDIKKQIDHGEYSSLEAVKDDLELIFSNAKQYNLTESEIFQDAKELLKLMNKTYNKMVPSEEDGENGKHKPPNLTRLMKSRLEKLVNKTDSQGRILSNEFMQLPSKKEWPIYYKEIKKPQCFDAIFKHIKRKEYLTSATFAADVELVFSNALQFNQEHTQIWDDAMTLRDHFRQLMSDMPPPHALPEYAKSSNKIKIKPRQNSQPVASGSYNGAPKQEQSGGSSFLLRVPAAQKAAAQPPTLDPPIPTPSAPAPTAKKQATATTPAAKAPTPQVPASSKAATPQPGVQTVSFINATPSHYPRAPYIPPAPPAASPAPVAATPPIVLTAGNAVSVSSSPAPAVLPLNRQLKSIILRMQPKGRSLTLDHLDGVKNWAVRLAPGETSILVSNVSYLGDEEEEESSGDEADVEKHEEDDEMDVDVEVETSPSSRNGRRRNKPRGRGRPPKAAAIAAKAAAAAKAAKEKKKAAVVKVGEIQLKLNNFVVKEQPDEHGEWSVQLLAGLNIIEVGEVGGMVWKVYAERLGGV